MIEALLEGESTALSESGVPLGFHPSSLEVHKNLKKWVSRFPFSIDESVYGDLGLLFLLASKKFLDHRNPSLLLRLILALHLLQKKLSRLTTMSPNIRHIEIRWIPTKLFFPFSHKPVLGCLVGFNLIDRYEVFDEENVSLSLEKNLPQLVLVRESSYSHISKHSHLKFFYFEIEKKNGTQFSFLEQNLLKNNVDEWIQKSIQPLSPSVYMRLTDEDTYKNMLTLSQEIKSLGDIPQAHITLAQQTGNEIIFRVNLVHASPFHHFSLKDHFHDANFVTEQVLTVRHLENHPIQAHIFRIHLPRDSTTLRSDGSLDYHSARQKVVNHIISAIGIFRDYNGGLILRQHEQLIAFRMFFPEVSLSDPELLEAFFFSLIPLEKQISLSPEVLSVLFNCYLKNYKLNDNSEEMKFSCKVHRNPKETYLAVRGLDPSLATTVSAIIEAKFFSSLDFAYSLISNTQGIFFNAVILHEESEQIDTFLEEFKETLNQWHQQLSNKQVLRIGLEHSVVSLDPRIGGETVSVDVLRLLFEGLTRFDRQGNVENALAESIEISADSQTYVFKLRHSLWNNGSALTAFDFEYAWKKVLSPDFKTSFAYLFYDIKNAKEAKEGLVPPEEIGIRIVDERTLLVELNRPSSHFLQWTAHPIYSPVNRIIDKQFPQWSYQTGKDYPCNGPFQLNVHHPNTGYQLIKNASYWDSKRIVLDQIILTRMNAVQGMQAFEKKEIDWLGHPFGVWDPIYEQHDEKDIISFPNSLVCWHVFNTLKFPFNNVKLRQAFAHAIERSQIANSASFPLTPSYSPLLPYHNERPQFSFPECNVEKAQQLLYEALKELKISKKDFEPINLLFHEKGVQMEAAVILQEQFKKHLDLDIELQPQSWKTLFTKMVKGDFAMGLMHWSSWVNDPISTLTSFKSSEQEVNFSKWENMEFKNLITSAEEEINPYQRSACLFKAEGILCQEMPVIPLIYQGRRSLVRKDFKINYRTPCGPYNIAWTNHAEKIEKKIINSKKTSLHEEKEDN